MMKMEKKKLLRTLITSALLVALLLSVFTLNACDPSTYAESSRLIIGAGDVPAYIGMENTVIVDMQAAEQYAAGHIRGAVNIPVSSILTSLPVENSLASQGKITTVLSEAGIGNDTEVIIYDEGNSLNASRLWWTMLVYGKDNVKVVSGGVPAMQAAGLEFVTDAAAVALREFVPEDRRAQYVTDMRAVREQVDNPNPNVILLDTRTNEEYLAEGKVPGSLVYSHTNNFYKDGTFIDTQAARIRYIEQGVRAENEIILFCRTSMRAAAAFLRLYDAGYRNLKIYDGAWLEWSTVGSNPIEMPAGAVASSPRDNS